MFSGDTDVPPPLPEEKNDMDVTPTSSSSTTSKQEYTVKNLNTGEDLKVAWNDPAMEANTNPFLLSWWGYLLIGVPVLLLVNDVVHFIPQEGPLSFLNQL